MAGMYDRGMAGLKDMAGGLSRIGLTAWLRLLAYSLLILGIYWSSLRWLIEKDWPREDYSHCYIIPFLVLYLIWEKRSALTDMASVPSWKGALPLLFGLGLYWLGELGSELFSLYMSLWLVIVGILWLHLGWEKVKIMAFPLLVLLAAFPPPHIVNVRILNGLKLISSQLGVAMLQLYGMSAYREGNIIDLGFTQLQVVDACSGLRYVNPLLVLSLVLAYWMRAHLWKKCFLVLSSVPLAIFVNSFRIALTGVLYSIWGAAVAEAFFHGFSGWAIFLFAIPLLAIEMWVLQWLTPKGQREEGRGKTALRARTMDDEKIDGRPPCGLGRPLRSDDGRIKVEGRGETVPPRAGLGSWTKRRPVFVVTFLLLAATLVLSRTIDFSEKPPARKLFKEFPLETGQFTGTRQTMESQFLEILKFTDYVIIDYRNAQGRDINFYVAYYESQKKGGSIHSPATCLPGSGWEFKGEGQVAVTDQSKGNPTLVNRAYLEKGSSKQLMYYWVAQRGRVVTQAYKAKLFNFWDSLAKRRTDGALVRVLTPLYPGESMQDADARLQEFTSGIMPILKEYVPE